MTATAPLTIVCDGCFSNLRRALCKPRVIYIGHFIAILICPYVILELNLFLFYKTGRSAFLLCGSGAGKH